MNSAILVQPLHPVEPAVTPSVSYIPSELLKHRVQDPIQLGLKRGLDLLLAALIFIAILPLLALIAVGIKLTSPGPAIYKSVRIGRDHQPFKMYKFRTMTVDADARRDELRAQSQLNGELFKLADDPRVTRFGQFLRKTSLDELPQLLNVLIGNMSLVGPRPLPPDESGLFQPPFTHRFDVLPGITGLWQISGRSSLGFQQLCELELFYVTHWSVWEDFKILVRTVPTVLGARGAC